MTVGNQTSQNVDKAVDRTAMTGMFYLWDVLELIDNTFDDGSFAQQEFVHEWHRAVFHVALDARDELHTKGFQQLLKKCPRDVASIRDQFAKQVF